MPPTRVERLTTGEQWEEAAGLLGQLWSEKTDREIRGWRETEGYRLFGCFAGEALVAVAGVSIQRVLHHVRHVWIHDFVVEEERRRDGYGTELLDAVESWARERDCEYVALALRAGNDSAGQFYREQGLDRWGDVLEKPLK